jgi:hypothetical protein
VLRDARESGSDSRRVVCAEAATFGDELGEASQCAKPLDLELVCWNHDSELSLDRKEQFDQSKGVEDSAFD